MSFEESFRDRQKSEIEVLKSIFGDELRDLRKNRQKKKWQPIDIIITLTPQKGMSGPIQVYAQVDLHITCSEKYPDEKPNLKLSNSQGLSDQTVAELFAQLEDLAEQLKGEVMIFELAQHAQKFLHEHNKPSYGSFYDEMLSRNQAKEKSAMEEKQMKEDKERQILQDEIQKRQEALRSELRDRKEMLRLSVESDNMSLSIPSSPRERVRTYSRRRCVSTSESSETSLCEHRGTKLLCFDNNKGERQVHRGKCLGHSGKGSVVYAGVDMTTGELLAITEWTLKCNNDLTENETTNLQHYLKQIASLEQELNHLHKLHHVNLVHYLNMKYMQDNNNIIIYILQEFVVGTTCSIFLLENIPVDIDLLRHIANGVLSALQYLHENNVVHKDIRDSSIHIDRTGLVKLSDYSLDKRMSDIRRADCLAKPEPDFPTIQGRGGKKADIYRFGILLLSLLKGSIVSEKEAEIGMTLQPDLKDFISKCLISDERSRWSADQLQEHSFIKVPVDRGMSPPTSEKKKQDKTEPEEPDSDIHCYFSAMSGQSRIKNEFEVLKWLGKGAFGDVLKVRNKLDGGIYAIKRIELNPKNKQLNKKITREVKLLSRMNHENVVRYYNSWIESATVEESCNNGRDTPATISITKSSNVSRKVEELGSIEKLAPPMHDVEWNVSASAVMSADSEEEDSASSSSDSESDEEWEFLTRTRMDSSDSIKFERDEISQTTSSLQNSCIDVDKTARNDDLNVSLVKEIQFMYIQMEFCEKSTLRTAIDSGGLHKDEERLWRLFREIVEGIAHIHQQGMIHRDLKPVNIFLDSNDHVKIGDFGLATTNILSTLATGNDKETQMPEKVNFEADDADVQSLTGQVGTALYVAPELTGKALKAIYNQKVDIYSLGIILFEMVYRPLTTGMERVKVLANIRSKEIILPEEITESEMPNQYHLLRWLLSHDPSQRPTSIELLASKYVPPLRLEEAEVQEMVRHTLSNTQSKAYKYLVGCCFSQEVTPAEDITYDMNLPTRGNVNLNIQKTKSLHESVKKKVVTIFQRHGGICFTTPLLMPKSGELYDTNESCVKLMTRTGNIVTIPYDLRAPFARYVAWNDITHLRRYAIERVYREKKVHGFHPRELYECAFDIISLTPNNLMAEAEVISIAWEIFNEIPQLSNRNFTVLLNHTKLLQAVLIYCGIESEKFQDIYSILCDARDGRLSKFQVQTHLISLCLTDQAMDIIFNLFETENSVSKITSILKTITKRKGEASALAREGLRDLEAVEAHLVNFGVKWPIAVLPLLVHNIQQHSGVMFQITCELKKRRKGGNHVIAAGGRYDNMLTSFRKVLERTGMASKKIKQCGVGISISFEKLTCAVGESMDEVHGEKVRFQIDCAVCCVNGEPKREKEMAAVLKDLWTIGLTAIPLDLGAVEEILEYCQDNSINTIVMLKSGETGSLWVQSWERDRFQEKKISSLELVEYVQRQIDNPLPALSRSESRVANSETIVSSNNPVNININFTLNERDKLSGSVKRSVKNTMLAQMNKDLQRISNKVPIEVFAVSLENNVIRSLGCFIEIDEEEQEFQKSIQSIIDKHPRHKKYIKQICEEMREVRNDKQKPAVILYSLVDYHYIILL